MADIIVKAEHLVIRKVGIGLVIKDVSAYQDGNETGYCGFDIGGRIRLVLDDHIAVDVVEVGLARDKCIGIDPVVSPSDLSSSRDDERFAFRMVYGLSAFYDHAVGNDDPIRFPLGVAVLIAVAVPFAPVVEYACVGSGHDAVLRTIAGQVCGECGHVVHYLRSDRTVGCRDVDERDIALGFNDCVCTVILVFGYGVCQRFRLLCSNLRNRLCGYRRCHNGNKHDDGKNLLHLKSPSGPRNPRLHSIVKQYECNPDTA